MKGAPGETRTPNLLIRSQVLYPLSYEGILKIILQHWLNREYWLHMQEGKEESISCGSSQVKAGNRFGINELVKSFLSGPMEYKTIKENAQVY